MRGSVGRWKIVKMVVEAKEVDKCGDGSFLTRVRGPVGRWKIVKIP